jgi:hypothetical protein
VVRFGINVKHSSAISVFGGKYWFHLQGSSKTGKPKVQIKGKVMFWK